MIEPNYFTFTPPVMPATANDQMETTVGLTPSDGRCCQYRFKKYPNNYFMVFVFGWPDLTGVVKKGGQNMHGKMLFLSF